jgi:nitrogen fixation/metabolism regulation signal transduction histidine kinase
MTLRTKIIGWFIVLHLVFAGAAVFVLMQNRLLLFAVEGCFVVSIIVSVRLVRALFVPLDLIRTGADLMAERDFTSRFVEVGQPEMDRLIGIYNDMVDRLRDERLATEEQHHLLQAIARASPSGIVICDFDGKIEQMNPAAERLLREPGLRSRLETPSGGGEPDTSSEKASTSTLVSLTGARRLRVLRAEFRDRGFAKRFYLLEELTEELRITEKAAYEKLIRMMSHEVNNSVGAVRSLLESLLRYGGQIRDADRGDFLSALNIASARVDNLNRFMSGFADVVRLPPPHPIETDMASLIEPIATLLRPELEQRDIVLSLDLARNDRARVDRHQIEQVVINILRNAMESIGSDGTIDVEWRDGVLSIRDSGRGIDPALEGELFTPFFTTKRDGRGLGLTIIGEILTNHRAPFSLQNRAGGGAEFRIVFA